MRKSIVCIVLLLMGCSTITPVIPTGIDSFMVISKGGINPDANKLDTFRTAGAFCKARGENLQVIDISTKFHIPFVRDASADLDFRCK